MNNANHSDAPESVTESVTKTGPETACPLRLGTRTSALALAQSGWFAEQVRRTSGREVELVPILSDGDRTTRPLQELGGAGVFVTALREALLSGEVDFVVHSLKDLPTAPCPGLALAAVPVREDPRDALVARDGLTLGELPPGSRIGTGSPRRAAQLRALALGVEIADIRGNVDSRIAKVRSGEYDAVVLARAGLVRLGRAEEITEVLDPLQMLCAPGQGALAVECRVEDEPLRALLAGLDHGDTRAAVTAERAVLSTLEAGCAAPVAAWGEVVEGEDGEELWIRALAVSSDGQLAVKMSMSGSVGDAEGVGTRLASAMLAEGAASVMAASDAPPGRRVQ